MHTVSCTVDSVFFPGDTKTISICDPESYCSQLLVSVVGKVNHNLSFYPSALVTAKSGQSG